MDLYEDSFKLQEMIASDMQSSLGECILPTSQLDAGSANDSGVPAAVGGSGVPGAGDVQSTTLTDLAPAVPVDPLDDPMDDDEQSWMNDNTSQLFANMDFENIDQGLLVNPQTGLPVNFPQAPAASPVISSSCTLDDSALGLTDGGIKMPSPQDHQSFPFFVIQQSEHLGQTEESMASSPSLKTMKAEPKAKKEKTRKTALPGVSPVLGEDGKSYPKPAYSYSCLIAMALKNSQSGSLPVNEIYNFMIEHFPYFKTAPNGWKNSVRHNLSLNKCFEKIEKPVTKGAPRKGCLWAMNPDKVSKMNEELHKWNARDPMAIRRSMANPDRLEQLSKGELKRDYEEDDYCQQPVVSTTEEDLVSLSPDQATSMTSGHSEGVSQETSPSPHEGGDSLPSLESNIQLDDLDLQYEACMELLGDSLSNSNASSQLGTLIGGQLSESNNNSQSQAVSFVQCNYIYSTADSESNVTSSLALGAAQEPLVTSTANVR